MYREFRPSAALEPYVECYWTRDASPANEARVLPDGCADILYRRDEKPHVVGTMTRPLVVDGEQASPIVAVRFRPGGAFPFFGVPMKELTDERVELRDLWRNDAPVESVAELDALLSERLAVVTAPDARIAEAVQRLRATGGNLRVARLSDSLGVSRQHLKRLFERHVGVGVKFFSRVVRLQSALTQLSTATPHWASIALDAGYYDQAHLIAEFRVLTGSTPQEYARYHFSNTDVWRSGKVTP